MDPHSNEPSLCMAGRNNPRGYLCSICEKEKPGVTNLMIPCHLHEHGRLFHGILDVELLEEYISSCKYEERPPRSEHKEDAERDDATRSGGSTAPQSFGPASSPATAPSSTTKDSNKDTPRTVRGRSGTLSSGVQKARSRAKTQVYLPSRASVNSEIMNEMNGGPPTSFEQPSHELGRTRRHTNAPDVARGWNVSVGRIAELAESEHPVAKIISNVTEHSRSPIERAYSSSAPSAISEMASYAKHRVSNSCGGSMPNSRPAPKDMTDSHTIESRIAAPGEMIGSATTESASADISSIRDDLEGKAEKQPVSQPYRHVIGVTKTERGLRWDIEAMIAEHLTRIEEDNHRWES